MYSMNQEWDFEKLAETFREMVENARDLGIDTVPDSGWKKLYLAVKPYADAGDWQNVNRVMREIGGLMDNNNIQLFESLDRHFGKPREYMQIPIEGDKNLRKNDIIRFLNEEQNEQAQYYRPLLTEWEKQLQSLGETIPNSSLPKSLFNDNGDFIPLSNLLEDAEKIRNSQLSDGEKEKQFANVVNRFSEYVSELGINHKQLQNLMKFKDKQVSYNQTSDYYAGPLSYYGTQLNDNDFSKREPEFHQAFRNNFILKSNFLRDMANKTYPNNENKFISPNFILGEEGQVDASPLLDEIENKENPNILSTAHTHPDNQTQKYIDYQIRKLKEGTRNKFNIFGESIDFDLLNEPQKKELLRITSDSHGVSQPSGAIIAKQLLKDNLIPSVGNLGPSDMLMFNAFHKNLQKDIKPIFHQIFHHGSGRQSATKMYYENPPKSDVLTPQEEEYLRLMDMSRESLDKISPDWRAGTGAPRIKNFETFYFRRRPPKNPDVFPPMLYNKEKLMSKTPKLSVPEKTYPQGSGSFKNFENDYKQLMNSKNNTPVNIPKKAYNIFNGFYKKATTNIEIDFSELKIAKDNMEKVAMFL